MKTVTVILSIALILAPSLVLADTGRPVAPTPTTATSADAALVRQMMNDPSVRRLLTIGRDLNQRARRADQVALAAAFKAHDASRFAALLQFTPEELAALNMELTTLRTEIFRKFPGVEAEARTQAAKHCGFGAPKCDTGVITPLADEQCVVDPAGCGSDTGPSWSADDPVPGEDSDPLLNVDTDGYGVTTQGVRCKWMQYVASLALCSLGGPFWYWPCAYVAICSFCSGGYVDRACF